MFFFLSENDEEQDEQDFPEEDDSIAEAIPNEADEKNPGS